MFTSFPTSASTLGPSSSSTLAPPSSFSRSSGVRSQLKKIPSTLFARSANTASSIKTSDCATENLERSEKPHRPILAHLSPKRAFARYKENEQSTNTIKAKSGKTRKGLAEIFHWGNSATSVAPPAKHNNIITHPTSLVHPSAPPVAPIPPIKDGKMPQVLKKRPSRPLDGKPSQAALNTSTSLRAPVATPQTRARPSMGADPFSRRGTGAEVVDTVSRHTLGSSVRSSARSEYSDGLSDKRASLASSKATSIRPSTEDKPHETVSEALQFLPAKHAMSKSTHPRISAPMPLNTLSELPPRSAFLGRVLENPVPKSNSSARLPSPALPNPHPVSSTGKTLDKEKTKSRVWGFFGRKKNTTEGSSKDIPGSHPSPQPRRAFEAEHETSGRRAYTTSYRKHQAAQTATYSQSKHPTDNSSSSTYTRPPAVHIHRPSTDLAEFNSDSNAQSCRYSTRSDAPPHSQITHSSRIHESVVGSASERPSVEGPRTNIVAALSQKGVPKRKSLSGIFGMTVKKSIEKLRPQASRKSLRDESMATLRRPPSSFNSQRLRSLAEEMETADTSSPLIEEPSVPYRSRYGNSAFQDEPIPAIKSSQGDLRRVASANDKLSALVSLDFSPAPNTPSDVDSLAPPSLASLDASPTPVRRIRSAVLTKKKSAGSPLKANANISPLKLALHRAQVNKVNKKKTPPSKLRSSSALPKYDNINDMLDSAMPTSMVRKGMRNIFAPPTPPRTEIRVPCLPGPSAALRGVDPAFARGSDVQAYEKDFDIPDDLKAIMGHIDMRLHDSNASPSARLPTGRPLGLPTAPPMDRIPPRRNNNTHASFKRGPAAVSMDPSGYVTQGRDQGVSLNPPRLTLDLIEGDCYRHSILSEVLSLGEESDLGNDRNSFDFTGEYAALGDGYQRASFVEAMASAQVTLPLGPISPLPDVRETSSSSFERVSEMLREAELSGELDYEVEDEIEDELEMEIATAVVQRTPRVSQITPSRTPRKSPFQGQPAFQAHIAQFKSSPVKPLQPPPTIALPDVPAQCDKARPPQPFSFVSQTAAIEPLPATRQGQRRAQRMDEAGLSIASMSSLGSIIETGAVGDFTNYFEMDFANHLNQQARVNAESCPGQVDHASSYASQDNSRPRRHHRRNSSVVSVESISEELAGILRDMSTGPPVSMHNARRSGYISRHRRSGSGEQSSFGRSDWAAHKRNSSVESSSSVVSLARIGRPGLGDRMFQLDGGVQLTSITGSPADDAASPEPNPLANRVQSVIHHKRENSYDSFFEHDLSKYTSDSLFDSSHNFTKPDSLFDSTFGKTKDSIFDVSAVINDEAVFGSSSKAIGEADRKFMLKGLRPVSITSEGSSQNSPIKSGLSQLSPMPKGPVESYEAEGEDETLIHSSGDVTLSGRQILSASIARPAKPRRRPARYAFHPSSLASQPDTPALSSPSTSETSSGMSLDTRFSSDGGSIFGSTGRIGHQRQKSSAHVQRQATIREEPSVATLRSVSVRPHVDASLNAWNRQVEDADEEDTPETIRYWNEWKREADDEYRRMKAYRSSSNSPKGNVANEQILTNADLMDFLARSAEVYKPLDQLPIGRHIPHRRKSSLSDSRQYLSPYGLPLPRPPMHGAPSSMPKAQPKRMSLETKFERKQKTSSGSYLTLDETILPPISTSPIRPSSAVFARFTTTVPESPAPKLNTIPFSPFAFPFDSFKRSNSDSPATVNAKRNSSAITGPERQRVNSNDRRAALGWGRRRNSDAPTKVEKMVQAYETSTIQAHRAMDGLPSDLRDVVANQVNQSVNIQRGIGKRSLPPFMTKSIPLETRHPALRAIPVDRDIVAGKPPFSQSTKPTNNQREPLSILSNMATLTPANQQVKSRMNVKRSSALHVLQDQKENKMPSRHRASSRRMMGNKPLTMGKGSPTPLRV